MSTRGPNGAVHKTLGKLLEDLPEEKKRRVEELSEALKEDYKNHLRKIDEQLDDIIHRLNGRDDT